MGKHCDCPMSGEPEVRYVGRLNSEIVIIGESPGREEVRENKPFFGRAGKLLNAVLEEVGIDRADTFIMNSLRCMLDKDQVSTAGVKAALTECRQNVITVLYHIKPKIIIALGDIALRQILKKSGITRARGHVVRSDEFNCWVMPTFHPAFILRNPGNRDKLVSDLSLVETIRQNNWEGIPKEDVSWGLGEIPEILNGAESFAYDTETQGNNWTDPFNFVIGYSVSAEAGKAAYVQLFHECAEDEKEHFVIQKERKLPGKRKKEIVGVRVRKAPFFKRKIKWLQQAFDGSRKVYMMNGLFDIHFTEDLFAMIGEECPDLRACYAADVQTMAQIINEVSYEHASLRDLQFQFTSLRHDYSAEFDLKYDKGDMLTVPIEDLAYYGAGDADTTFRVAASLKKTLLRKEHYRQARYYVEFVQPVTKNVLYEMEMNGNAFDSAGLPAAIEEVEDQMWAAHDKAVDMIPGDIYDPKADYQEGKFVLTRTAIVREMLFSKKGLRLTPIKQTKSGQDSVDADTRKDLLQKSGLSKKARDFLTAFDEWKELQTLHSRYLIGLPEHVACDGRVHSSFSFVRTGRLASARPNMQNIPKRTKTAKIIRRLFIAPPGYVLMAIDQSQAELRFCAHLSGDPAMKQVYIDGGDIHAATAEALSGKKRSEMSEAEFKKARQQGKPCNFGIIYKISPASLADSARRDYGVDITESEARTFMRKWFNKYSTIQQYHDRCINHARKFGYVESPFGRRRHLPEIHSDDRGVAGYAERQAVNTAIQGASSDTVLYAASNMLGDGVLDPKEILLVNFVHDEIVFQVKDDEKIILKYYSIIKDYMEHPPLERLGCTLTVPLEVDGKIGRNLAEMDPIS